MTAIVFHNKNNLLVFVERTPHSAEPTPYAEDIYEEVPSSFASDTDDLQKRTFFEKCGKIVRIIIPKNNFDNSIRGFCFIWFTDEITTKNALSTNGSYLNGKMLKVSPYNPPKVLMSMKIPQKRRRTKELKTPYLFTYYGMFGIVCRKINPYSGRLPKNI